MERRPSLIMQFLVRVILGIALILMVNKALDEKEIHTQVGINPVSCVVSGIMGVPGVALLYGVVVYTGL